MLLYLRLFKESFSFALNALKNNKLRTFLSLLGVTVGIFSIIGVLAAVDSLDQSIKSDLSGLDKNTIYLTKYSFGPTTVPRWQRESYKQVENDAFEFVQRNVPDIQAVAYVMFGGGETMKFEDKTISGVEVTPVSNGIYEIDDLKIDSGRMYTESESNSGQPVIVIGDGLSKNLFENEDPIGKQIRVYGRKVTVVGKLKKFGQTLFDSPDEKAFLPANFVRRFRNGGSDGIPGAVIIKPKAGIDIGAFEQVLKQKFRNYRGLKAGEPDNFFVNKLSGMTDAIDGIISFMNKIGVFIGMFSLLVGGFGIANIMFVSVRERTNLIGIQKSLGAKNKFILMQFLFEALVLSIMGGIIGLTLVWLLTIAATSLTNGFPFILSGSSIFWGIFCTLIVGLVAGILPAISASRMDPVEAIRTGM